MAWKFPKRKIESGEPTGVGDINENFAEYSQESGSINEHNFRSNAISSRTELAATAGFVITSASQAVNPNIADGSSGPDNSTDANNDIVGTANAWTPIDDLSVTVKTEDSPLWVLASLQRFGSSDVSFAISVDGYVLPESVIGGVTYDNDPYGNPATPQSPYALDVVIPVAAGTHTVQVVAKFHRRASFPAASANLDAIQNRELIVVEMRR